MSCKRRVDSTDPNRTIITVQVVVDVVFAFGNGVQMIDEVAERTAFNAIANACREIHLSQAYGLFTMLCAVNDPRHKTGGAS